MLLNWCQTLYGGTFSLEFKTLHKVSKGPLILLKTFDTSDTTSYTVVNLQLHIRGV